MTPQESIPPIAPAPAVPAIALPRPGPGPVPWPDPDPAAPSPLGLGLGLGLVVAALLGLGLGLTLRRRASRRGEAAPGADPGEGPDEDSPARRLRVAALAVRAALVAAFGPSWNARTTEEVARDLALPGRFGPDLAGGVVAFLRRVDRARFGGEACEDVDDLVEAGHRLARRLREPGPAGDGPGATSAATPTARAAGRRAGRRRRRPRPGRSGA